MHACRQLCWRRVTRGRGLLSLKARGGEEVRECEHVKVEEEVAAKLQRVDEAAHDPLEWWEGMSRKAVASTVMRTLTDVQEEAAKSILRKWEEDADVPVVLHGLTGTGKTRVMCAVASGSCLPVLVLTHNKELAQQLYAEMNGLSRHFKLDLLMSAFEKFVPDRIDEEKGVIKKGFGKVDREVARLRGEALCSLGKGKCPVIVASISSLYPTSIADEVMTLQERETAHQSIMLERREQVLRLRMHGQEEEARRLFEIVEKDLGKLQAGHWRELQHYARHFPKRLFRAPAERLVERFGRDWVLIVEECHAMLPRLSAAAASVSAHRRKYVEKGFMMSSCSNAVPVGARQLFSSASRKLFVSATPESRHFEQHFARVRYVRLVQRPTHILDPVVSFVKMERSFYSEMFLRLHANAAQGRQSLVACCTTAEAELLALRAMEEFKVDSDFVHGSLPAPERRSVIASFREGGFDVLFGVSIIREGMNFPGVSLVYVLDADTGNGLSRTASSLLQFVGRAARHTQGEVVLAYRRCPNSHMEACKRVSEEQRGLQQAFNRRHGLSPVQLQQASRLRRTGISPGLRRMQQKARDLQEILEGIPGVGAKRAASIAKSCSGKALERDPGEELKSVHVDGVGLATSARVQRYLSRNRRALQPYLAQSGATAFRSIELWRPALRR